MTPVIAGILLAGGVGRRFDPSGARLKLLEPAALGPHAGAPLAAAACRNLKAALADVIAVVRPADTALQRSLRDLLQAEGCHVVECAGSVRGMGASLACGVRSSRDAAGWIVALADMPAIRPGTIATVADALRAGHRTAAPYVGPQRGHPVGFGAELRDALAALDGDIGARELLQRIPPFHVEVDDPGCLLDVDEPSA
ncbi:MAG TPA: nucleotidyltransferase family protein [Burkholderiaceae bacterium]|nr:nucleotidyltransferase family protein [Burkholderiaceae bacterium]